MKIAFITPEYVTEAGRDGGLANYLFKISLALRDRGHSVFVLVNSGSSGILEHRGVTIIRVGKHSRAIKLLEKTPLRSLCVPMSWILQSLRLCRELKSLHRETGIDVAQYASYTAVALAAPAHIRSIVRVSSYQPMLDQAYEKPKSVSRRICNYLELRALRNSRYIYCPSQLLADTVGEQLGRQVGVIESPLSPYLNPDESVYTSKLSGKRYALYFGTLAVLKGLREISEILPKLFELYPDLHFVFAGKDSVYDGKSMVRYIQERAGIHRERCIFLGSLEQAALQPIIREAELITLPSRVDNLPNTCIEAMSLGRVVVATRGASFDQLITNGVNGFLCEIDNPESLLESVRGALDLGQDQRERIGANAVSRTWKLRPDLIAKQLEALCQEVISASV